MVRGFSVLFGSWICVAAFGSGCGSDAGTRGRTTGARATDGGSDDAEDSGSDTADGIGGAASSESDSGADSGNGSQGGSSSGSSSTGGSEDGTSSSTTGGSTDDGVSAGSSTTGGIVGTTTGDDGGTTGAAIGDPCVASVDCNGGLVCAASECVIDDGTCTDHEDCSGDTYCCKVADGCMPAGEPDTCIPFGSGPKGDINDECSQAVEIGLFEPSIQCQWNAPPPGDPYPDHISVLATPMVADLPHDSGAANEIVIVTYNHTDGGLPSGQGTDPLYFGVIRVLNGQTCEQLESIADPANPMVGASPPSIADLDGDGVAEIVTQRGTATDDPQQVIAFQWNGTAQAYETYWVTTEGTLVNEYRWDGPSIHDINDDGLGEVLSGSEVFDGVTGAKLNTADPLYGGARGMQVNVLADVDGDGAVELVADDVHRWDDAMQRWTFAYDGRPGAMGWGGMAVADFGTPGAMPSDFDPMTLDGIAEIATASAGTVQIHTLSGQELLSASGIVGGGPPTIGDFDNDGFPEVASAGGNAYRVFDLDCAPAAMNPECSGDYVRWEAASQDFSSQVTGSSIFDFEGDGQAEAVYGDECYIRVYEGKTGEVLFSAPRTSCTWLENPVVADVDRDDNTEILVGSNTCGGLLSCANIDPIHRGTRCMDGADCGSGTCDAGFCRCTDDMECPSEHTCTAPPAGTPGAGANTCRATHAPGLTDSGVRVYRDRLDRWASSRALWTQHAYAVTHIGDDMRTPATSAWSQNFTDPTLNNFRQNTQGAVPPDALPDITGKLDEGVCETKDAKTTLTGTVCNRGEKSVGATLPATFYEGDPANNVVLCVAYTSEPVPVGDCRPVTCEIPGEVFGVITMMVNDDGMGGQTTLECLADNNDDEVTISFCIDPG